jgi:hypothetical protein
MENKLKLLKKSVRDCLAVLGKKLPRTATNGDLKIIALVLSNKIDLGLDEVLESIRAKADKACIAANKVN